MEKEKNDNKIVNNNNAAAESAKPSVFSILYGVDVSAKLGKKRGLSYLSWADAEAEVKKRYPDRTHKIYTRRVTTKITKTYPLEGGGTKTVEESYETDIPYFHDGRTCFVEVGVTIEGHEEKEIFPVRNVKNGAVPVDLVTMVDVNKALQRAFVKACARQGLGLYVYAGEDLPENRRINWKDWIKEAERAANPNIDQAEFTKELDIIIAYIKALGDKVDPTLYSYVQSLFANCRLTQLSFDNPAHKLGVSKLFYLIQKLDNN